mmetsp:Transcript_21772/g.47419  ORF Transcript_21772/g.47419 Transcript_21772/m.47419 type:complete len:121 (-) Transcript_21772:148-510(-)
MSGRSRCSPTTRAIVEGALLSLSFTIKSAPQAKTPSHRPRNYLFVDNGEAVIALVETSLSVCCAMRCAREVRLPSFAKKSAPFTVKSSPTGNGKCPSRAGLEHVLLGGTFVVGVLPNAVL